jgi:hypothetical protein
MDILDEHIAREEQIFIRRPSYDSGVIADAHYDGFIAPRPPGQPFYQSYLTDIS